MKFGKKLKAETIPVASVDLSMQKEMFALYQNYYENVEFEQFQKDMSQKTSIIILTAKNNQLKGFSTLTSFDVEIDKKSHHIIYSGDTIIDPSYWGTAALTMEFLKNIMLAKMNRPLSPVWWFLISKGYKTYLLMANNFINYYPRYDRATPDTPQQIMNMVSEKLYPNRLDQEKGILTFDDGRHEKLKDFVAPITEAMKEKWPKIKFFEEKNPHWEKGDELVCLGEVSLMLAIVHPSKVINKSLKKMGQRMVAMIRPAP